MDTGLPKEAYTPWLTRVLAYLIDYIPVAIIQGIGYLLLIGTRETACITDTSEYDLGEFCATGASTIGQLSIGLTSLVALAYVIWNLGYRQGTTGSSIGKGIMKFKVVSEKTGQPIGFGMSLVREIIYLVLLRCAASFGSSPSCSRCGTRSGSHWPTRSSAPSACPYRHSQAGPARSVQRRGPALLQPTKQTLLPVEA